MSASTVPPMWIFRGRNARSQGFCGHLLPPSRGPKPGPTTTAQSLTDDETLKWTFRDPANRCQQKSTYFTPEVFDRHAGWWRDSARNLVTWISRRLSTPSDVNLELVQRISASLHRDSARATFALCPLGSHDGRPPLAGSDDWWLGRSRFRRMDRASPRPGHE